ncbi:uncharacterized protein LOC141903487 [Tubulanus polymorphus]|uniref:uncharacterized protein LOC141903487 n=1 Tax=Tubulanus polymorphus TaxID=672921 RepID=UPI003DA371DC
MSPHYNNTEQTRKSEYSSNYEENQLLAAGNGPLFPRINTCRVKLPITTSCPVNHVSLGTDTTSFETETGQAYCQLPRYGRRAATDNSDISNLQAKMKEYELSSSVFRDGDYNDKGLNKLNSTFMRDFGRPSNSDTDIAINRNVRKAMLIKAATSSSDTSLTSNAADDDGDKDAENDGDDVPGLIQYSLQNKEEKTPENQDHTVAHIKLGNEEGTPASIYSNDFYPTVNVKPFIQPPPEDSQVLQRDLTSSNDAKSVYTQHHCLHGLKMNAPKNTAKENMIRRHAVNVAITLDPQQYSKDRQKSLSQDVYRQPPITFRPLPPQRAQITKYNPLTSDDVYARSHSRKLSSENQVHNKPFYSCCSSYFVRNNFVGAFIDPSISRTGRQQCCDRRSDARSTHFILGYDSSGESRFRTEAKENFSGESSSGVHSPPAAGKAEEVAPFRFEHFGISDNISDVGNKSQQQSLMGSDYRPLEKRKFTNSQLLVMQQNARIESQKIESSHLFHTDNSGLNNYVSMSMVDYLPPIYSDTGRKFNMIQVR